MREWLKKLGKFLRRKRRDADLSQKELSEKIGVTPNTISSWEIGNKCPSAYFFMKLYEILKFRIEEIDGKECGSANTVSTNCPVMK